MFRVWLGLILTLVVGVSIASADVGDVILCRSSNGSSTHSDTMNANNYHAQTFLASSSGVVAGVKLPLTFVSGSASFTVRLYPTTVVGADIVPDIPGGVLAAADGNLTTTLPADTGTSADQAIQCNTTNRPTQVFEFAVPYAVSAGITYAIVVNGGTGANWNAELEVIIGDVYPQGEKWSCSEVTFDCTTDSNDWIAAGHGQGDESAFVVFGTIVTLDEGQSIDTWVLEWLERLGLNDEAGKLLVAGFMAMAILIVLAASRVHPIVIMAVLGLWTSAATILVLIPGFIIITLASVVAGAALIGFIILKGGGDEL